MWTVLFLVVSNVFMTIAWYGHLKHHKTTPLAATILASWGIAFVEYCFKVPANRWGSDYYRFSTVQLKTIQEILSLVIFACFSAWYLGERLRWNHAVAFLLLVVAVWFAFKKWD